MSVWFKNLSILFFFSFILSIIFSTGYAFMPEGKDILKLAVEKIVEPVGFRIEQKRKVFFEGQELKELVKQDIMEEAGVISEEQIVDENPFYRTGLINEDQPSHIEISEKLWFSFPGQFRSEAIAGSHEMICVDSEGKFVKIIDEFIESKEKDLTDLYTDILLFRQAEYLQEKLIASGVDMKLSSLKRHEGTIYFVIGVPPSENIPSSSLWVEKDTFFPSRYTILKKGLFVDIYYKHWKKFSHTWYPMETVIFLDGILFSKIATEHFKLQAYFGKNLFDVKRLLDIYPESINCKTESGSVRIESDEVEKSIEEFEKLYE